MSMRRITMISVALLLSGCGVIGNRGNSVLGPHGLSISPDAPMPTPCNGAGADNPGTGTVVRVVIPEDFSWITPDPKDATGGRRVWHRTKEPASENENDDLALKSSQPNDPPSPGASDPEFHQNPFHIDIRAVPKGDEWVMVRVILVHKDPANPVLIFGKTPPLPGPSGMQGMIFSEKISWICQPTNAIEDKNGYNPKYSVLKFYVHRINKEQAGINIVVVPNGATIPSFGQQTPILIDPKIYNDG